MKLMIVLVFGAALMACGGKSKNNTTPTGSQTETAPDGTGGTTYGGATPDQGSAVDPTDPCAAD